MAKIFDTTSPLKRGGASPEVILEDDEYEEGDEGKNHLIAGNRKTSSFDFISNDDTEGDDGPDSPRFDKSNDDDISVNTVDVHPAPAASNAKVVSNINIEECGGLQLIKITDQLKVKETNSRCPLPRCAVVLAYFFILPFFIFLSLYSFHSICCILHRSHHAHIHH